MPSAEMRATETGAAARARTAETCSPEVAAAAAAETGTATEVTATTAKVTATATDMTATAAEVAAATTTTAVAAATTTATASLRRGSGTDQKDRENNGQDIEFRHGTLKARGLRRERG
jgi:hypothetical protein